MPSLAYTLATIYESLRLRDIVMTLPKLVAEDTFIPYTTWTPSATTNAPDIPGATEKSPSGTFTTSQRLVKKGSHVIIDSPACQRNPQVWTDPPKFDPSRHLNHASRNIFTGFSMGVRQCIGKRFAEVEMVAMISHLVCRYKIYPVALEGETLEDTKKRYEKGSEELSFTPDNWDIKLERREV